MWKKAKTTLSKMHSLNCTSNVTCEIKEKSHCKKFFMYEKIRHLPSWRPNQKSIQYTGYSVYAV